MSRHFFLYGPPGSGKSTLGALLADALGLPFVDLDETIAAQAGMSIPQIFAAEGEQGFRKHEYAALRAVVGSVPMKGQPAMVIALGGGALLNELARGLAEQRGKVLLLRAKRETLAARVAEEAGLRPLLGGQPPNNDGPTGEALAMRYAVPMSDAGAQREIEEKLAKLLDARDAHYGSFPLQLETDSASPNDLLWQAQVKLGAFRVRGMGAGCDARVDGGGLESLSEYLNERDIRGPLAVVTDSNVAPLHGERVIEGLLAAGFAAHLHTIPAGEEHKTIATVQEVWDFFLRAGVERGSCVIALGGGVVGDLTGFAAATYLRGVPWVNLPTTLLSMVDSSLGGKTGVDLPQAKNMVGAFYPPALTLADPSTLATLPERELRGGMAEVVKHGIIGDPALFDLCAAGWEAIRADMQGMIKQAMAVKMRVIEEDPYEKGPRQALNLGHTIGHGVELASGFRVSHGEAVSIGTVMETRLAEELGLAERGLTVRVRAAFAGLGLPVRVPAEINLKRVVEAMGHDKKRASGTVRFALPERIGAARTGVTVENWQERVLWLLTSEQDAPAGGPR